MESPYDTGMGTTPGMWEILCDELAEAEIKLPISLWRALSALASDEARVIRADEVDRGGEDGR